MATKLQKAVETALPLFLTLDELAWHLRVSRSTALKMLRRGEFPTVVRIGEAGHYRIPRTAVEEWEERQAAARTSRDQDAKTLFRHRESDV